MSSYAFDNFVFDDVRFHLSLSGQPIKADAQVLELLACLLHNAGRLVTKEELIETVWEGRMVTDNVISVCIAKLRKVLKADKSKCLTTVYGRGYRFTVPVVRLDDTDRPTQPEPAVRSTQEMPLIGRSDVQARLQRALRVAQRGRGSVCALLGEAGIGKTRLCEALEAEALRVGFAVSWSHCHRLGDDPALWPFLKLLRTWGLPLEAANEPEPGSKHASYFSPGNDRWRRTMLATMEAIETHAATRPQLILIEDVHWADTASLQLLSHMLSTVTHHKLLIVLTVRDTQRPDDPERQRILDYILGQRDCRRIPLPRLARQDVDHYVQTLLGSADAAIAHAVYAKSQGNPFFMVELLRPFEEGGTPRAQDLQLPSAALDIVRQSLEHVGQRGYELLRAASVIGRSFDLGLLSQVMDERPFEVLTLFEPALSRRVIAPRRDSHAHFEFGHDLIRDVVYQDLSSLTRRELHARIGRILALRASLDGTVPDAEIAQHLLAGLPVSDAAETMRCARAAARSASRMGAYADACSLLRGALDALALQPDMNPRVACELVFDLARYERAAGLPFEQHLERAVELARGCDHARVLVAAGQLVCGPPGTMSVDGAAELLEGALGALPEEARSERVILLSHLSWTAPYSWERERVERLLREADHSSKGVRAAALRAMLRARLYYASGPDDFERAEAMCQVLEDMEAPHGMRQRALSSIEPLFARLVAQVQRGDLPAARWTLESFGTVARELQHAELQWHHERLSIVLRMIGGDFAFATTALPELARKADQLQLHGRQALAAVDFSELAFETVGKPTRPLCDPVAWRPRASDSPLKYAVKLRVLCQLGCLDEVRTELAAFKLERLRDLPKSRDYLAVLGHFAFACAQTGAKRAATLLYEMLEPYPELCIATLSLHCYGTVSRTLSMLAELMGEHERARAHCEQALAATERFELRPQLAHTRHQYALLLRHGSRADLGRARALAAQAHQLASSLGMQPLSLASERLHASLR